VWPYQYSLRILIKHSTSLRFSTWTCWSVCISALAHCYCWCIATNRCSECTASGSDRCHIVAICKHMGSTAWWFPTWLWGLRSSFCGSRRTRTSWCALWVFVLKRLLVFGLPLLERLLCSTDVVLFFRLAGDSRLVAGGRPQAFTRYWAEVKLLVSWCDYGCAIVCDCAHRSRTARWGSSCSSASQIVCWRCGGIYGLAGYACWAMTRRTCVPAAGFCWIGCPA